MTDYSNNLIYIDQPLTQAMQQLNRVPEGLTLFVRDYNDKVMGTLTDGDIRRGLLAGKQIGEPVSAFMHKNFRYLTLHRYTLSQLDELRNLHIRLVPLLDEAGVLQRIIDLRKLRSLLPVEVVIMAGGRGERLRPLTDTTPKPLLKVGDKPIIEHNIDRLSSFGIATIHISIRYLGSQLKEYLGNGESKGLTIQYIHEDEPLGTLGAVSKIQEFTHPYVLIMNSDLLTTIDFEDFFRNFMESGAAMTVASIPYKVNVPYAVLETEGNRINSFQEKPTYTFYSNAGMYLVKKEVLQQVPQNSFYNATDLLDALIQKGDTVSHYPLLGYWLDIGKHDDYKKAQQDIKHLKL